MSDGSAVSYQWDMLNRLTSRCNSSICDKYFYDEDENGRGFLTTVTNESGTISYKYNGFGQITQQTNIIEGATYVTKWDYSHGLLYGMTYPSGLSLNYAYQGGDRLKHIGSNITGSPIIADSFLYQPVADDIFAWRNGNGTVNLKDFDTDGRVAKLEVPGILKKSFVYSTLNLIERSEDSLDISRTTQLEYDKGNRLSSVGRQDYTHKLVWDPMGNLESGIENNVGYTFVTDPNTGRLSSVNSGGFLRDFEYDLKGNIETDSRTDGVRRYFYNAFNKLKIFSINNVNVAEYLYNGFDQRSVKKIGSTTTHFIYDPNGQLIYESGENPTGYVWLEGDLLGIHRGGNYYTSHNDHLGRPELLTNTSRSVVGRVRNSEFGREGILLNDVGGLNVGLPGQYYDQESALWYNWNRYYDQNLGRYSQADPIGLDGGVNRYAYAYGNPVHFIDFDGLTGLRNYRHHWVPQSTYNGKGLPDDARRVFARGVTVPLSLHQYDGPHRLYMEGANDLWDDLIKKHKINPSTMTVPQAQMILDEFRKCPDPRMKPLQRQIWQRAMWESLRRIPVRSAAD